MPRFPARVLVAALFSAVIARAQAPANDNFANAQTLTFTQNSGPVVFGVAAVGTGDNTDATGEPGEPAHASVNVNASSIWFKWVPPGDGAVFISAVGTVPPWAYALYTGSTLTSLQKLSEFTSRASTVLPLPQIQMSAGTTYYLAIGSDNTPVRGPIAVQVSFRPAPLIASQPTTRIAAAGDAASFSVGATQPGTTVLWFHNGIALGGATSAALSIASAQVADGGTYHATLTNSAGTTTSNPAVLRGPNPPPTITTHPTDRIATAGNAASFTVAASGTGPLQYQWRRNGFPLSDATEATFTIPTASRSDIDFYDVRVNDGLSVTYSTRVRLDVQPNASPPRLSIDPAFNTVLEAPGGSVMRLRRTAAGGILVAGSFLRYDGATGNNLARLRSDATVDPTFSGAEIDGIVFDAAPLPDGKIVVIGTFTRISGVARAGIARLNADGSLDPSFTVEPTIAARSLRAIIAQPDGRLIIAGNFTATSGALSRDHLVRLTADGRLDGSFSPQPSAAASIVESQPDGKLIVSGGFATIGGASRRFLARLDANGVNDATFDPGSSSNFEPIFFRLAPDGRIYVSGGFSQFNGSPAGGLVRLQPNGALDPTFSSPPPGTVVFHALPLSDGRVIVASGFQSNPSYITRLSATGAVDQSFSTDQPAREARDLLALDDGRVLLGGLLPVEFRIRPIGGLAAFQVNGAFDPRVSGTLAPAAVTVLQLLGSGKILVAGDFTRVNGSARAFVARLNADGTLDPAFAALPNEIVYDVAVQGDGRLLITGMFTHVGPTARSRIARLNADGSLDPLFNTPGLSNTTPSAALSIRSLDGGRALLASRNLGGYLFGRRIFARLHANGMVDETYRALPNPSDPSFALTDFAVTPDERVLHTNDGTLNSGFLRALGRLESNGNPDPTFTIGAVTTGRGSVYCLAPLADGRILVGGSFAALNEAPRNRLARVLRDGQLDAAFVPAFSPVGTVRRLISAADGTLYALSDRSEISAPGFNLDRLAANGSSDATFGGATFTANALPSAAVMLDDGNLLLAGPVFSEGEVTRFGLMRTRALPLATTSEARFVNVSVRANLAAGQTLTVGLGIAGNGNTKRVLIRAAGPALAGFGVTDFMVDPRFDLFSRAQRIGTNNDWGPISLAADFSRVGAFPFSVPSRDAAVLAPLLDNTTVVASGTGPGVVLVECYDADPTSPGPSRLLNLSARNRVGAGGDVMVAGFFIAGRGSHRVLARAVGPALSAFGVVGTLANPKLELFDAAGTKLAENDDWPAALAPTFTSVGAFPLPSGSRDAALVATLTAGRAYTVQVSGVGGATGEALVELYELP